MGNINQELERLQLISDFLKGKLSPKQLEKFKRRLKIDAVLAEELQKHKKLIELLKKKQERDIASLLNPENDLDYMKQERIYRRNQLRQELNKIKNQKIDKQENWQKKVTQSNQPSICKMAIIFALIIAIGAGMLVVTTQLIKTQNKKKIQEKRGTESATTITKLPQAVMSVQNYTGTLVFEWNETTEEETYLQVINSKREVTTYKNIKNPFTLEQNFEKGIYYWSLQTDSKVIKIGKFLVK